MLSKKEQYAEFLKYGRVYDIPSDANLSKLIPVVPENLRAIVAELACKGTATGHLEFMTDADAIYPPINIFVWCECCPGILGGNKAMRWNGSAWFMSNGQEYRGRVYNWQDELPQITRNRHFE